MLDAQTHTQSHQTWCCLGDIYGRTGKLNEVRMEKTTCGSLLTTTSTLVRDLSFLEQPKKKHPFQKTERIATNESKT